MQQQHHTRIGKDEEEGLVEVLLGVDDFNPAEQLDVYLDVGEHAVHGVTQFEKAQHPFFRPYFQVFLHAGSGAGNHYS